MKNIILQIIGLIFISNSVLAQSQIVFDKTKQENFLLKVSGEQNSIKNGMLRKMAKGNSKPVGNVQITYSFTQKRQILKRGNQLEFIVKLQNFKLSGDEKYRDFPMKKKLVPSKLSFRLQWLKGKQVIKTVNFNNISVSGNNIEIVKMTVKDTLRGRNVIKILNKTFDYTRNDKRKFDEKTKLIDDYHSEDAIIKNKLRKITSIKSDEAEISRINDINKIYNFRDLANNSLNYAKQVKHKIFYKKLNLQTFDPKALKRKVEKLENRSEILMTSCNNVINNLDAVYYNRGIDMLVKRNISRAKVNFNKSIEINPQFAPSHFQLAKLSYMEGHINHAVDKLFKINGMRPDPETQTHTTELADKIYKDFLLEANILNNRKRFDDALIVLDNAYRICHEFQGVGCLSNMDNEFSRAVSGKYNFILHDIDLAISKNNLRKAEQLTGTAKNYQIKNSDFIRNDNEITVRIIDIYKKYIANGNYYSKQRYFEKAIQEFNEAERICNKYRKINCTPELDAGYLNARTGIYRKKLNDADNSMRRNNFVVADNLINSAIDYRQQYNLQQSSSETKLLEEIKQAIYSDYIKKGERFLYAKNYQSALENFEKASETEQKYNVNRNYNLSKNIHSSAEGLSFKKIKLGKSKVSINDLSSARTYYSEAKSLINRYKLTSNSKLNKAKNELKDMIFKQECINAGNTYDNYYKKAIDFISAKKYIDADNTLATAINHANENLQCDISTFSANAKKNEIAPAVNFMKQMNIAEKELKRRNFQSTINKYKNAGDFYRRENISSFGLNYDNLFDFISSKHSKFINFSVGYYSNIKEYEKAILLLKILSNRDFKRRATKNYQSLIGTEIAIRDFDENPNTNYKTNIIRYTGGDSFFKFFAKAYKKQWKKLD